MNDIDSKTKRIPVVAIVGRPNVGKSTLFNRLTRTRQALVDATPGLTRDRRYADVAWHDLTARIIDTGGLEKPEHEDEISRLVYEQSVRAVEEADLLLLLVDGQEGLNPVDREIVNTLRRYSKPTVLAVNKLDNPEREAHAYEFLELGMDNIVHISAEHGRGVAGLIDTVTAFLKEMGETPGGFKGGEARPATGEEVAGLEPIRVAIVGRPNVGKSTLVNRLLGEPRMIVTDIPGTTLDALDSLVARPGKRELVLTDTAGIRRRARVKGKIEKFSAIKAIEEIRKCDVAVVVLDASEGITEQDKRIIGYTEKYGKACITLYNKWDLLKGEPSLVKLRTSELNRAKRFIPYAPHLNVSAMRGKKTDKIFSLVDRVYQDFTTTATTGKVNQILQRAVAVRNPPISKGHHIRLYYATQVSNRPPTVLIFANYPEYVPEQYRRFLANQFREQLNLEFTPMKILFRKRERRE